jgi:NitT/TauT family transport system substrate-binding protein/sulfonate transport system substrate-binding protein
MRRWSGAVALLAALTAACGGAASQPSNAAGASQKFVVHYGFINPKQSAGATGPIGWAMRTGALRRELAAIGVEDVQAVAFGNAPDLEAAMQGGSVDVGDLSDTGAIVARAAGVDTRLIAINRIGLDAWLIARKNGPTSPAELRGRPVATLTGSYLDRYLYGLLQADGLLGRVTETSLYLPDAFAALQRGDIDAYTTPMPQAAVWADQGFPVIDRASSHPGLTGNLVTVAASRFLTAHPGFATAWDRALSAAVADLKGHVNQYYAFEAADQGYPESAIEVAIPMSQYSTNAFPPEGLTELPQVARFLVNAKLARTMVDIDSWRYRGR